PFLLQLANSGEREDTGAAWITVPKKDDGASGQSSRTGRARPLGIEALARVSRWSVKEMREILDELVEVGTMVIRDDGAYGFPRFLDFQESPEAKKKRIQRLRSQGAEVASDVDESIPDATETYPEPSE